MELWTRCFDGMQMTQKILEAEGEGDAVQLDFFLKGNLALEKDPRRKPHSWLPDQVICRFQLVTFCASKSMASTCSLPISSINATSGRSVLWLGRQSWEVTAGSTVSSAAPRDQSDHEHDTRRLLMLWHPAVKLDWCIPAGLGGPDAACGDR